LNPSSTITMCLCVVAQRAAALAPSTCEQCGQAWEPIACEGCAEAREYLSRQRDAHGHRNPRAWVRCDECGEVVAVDDRGLQSALDATVRADELADRRLRQRRMLADFDNLAKWIPYLEGHSTEPSPIVGDGNVGGGAKISATDRPDWVNDDCEGIRRAHATGARLVALERQARSDHDARMRARDALRASQRAAWARACREAAAQSPSAPRPAEPSWASEQPPTSLERGVAVLRWLVERTGPSTRAKLAFRIGMAFGGRATAAQRTRDLGALKRRLSSPVPTAESIAARKLAIATEYRDVIRAATQRRASELQAADGEFTIASAIETYRAEVASAHERRARETKAIVVAENSQRDALTPARYRELLGTLPPDPTEEAVKTLGQALLTLADETWQAACRSYELANSSE
jgi:hypothetical protein